MLHCTKPLPDTPWPQAQQDMLGLGLQASRAWSELVQGCNESTADANGNSH